MPARKGAGRSSGSGADFVRALRERDEISITVTGRRSGKAVTLPVWFVLDRHILRLLPVYGSRTQWFRNVRANPAMVIRVGRRRRAVTAHPFIGARAVRLTIKRFRQKYGTADIARYYTRLDAAVRISLSGDARHA